MIVLGTMKDLKRNTYNEVWFIMQSVDWLKDQSIFNYANVFHVPSLAPSRGLFSWFFSKKSKGEWNIHTFNEKYVPKFMKEKIVDNDGSFRRDLNSLWFKSKNGKKILLICSCPDEELCHRSIIGGILMGAGVDVHSTTQDVRQYLKYADLFKQENEKYKQEDEKNKQASQQRNTKSNQPVLFDDDDWNEFY